ncbi:MAG: NHLP bacteriocin export ABC transporter permease/ATPase subunit [Gammaproteobacteria bacterium]
MSESPAISVPRAELRRLGARKIRMLGHHPLVLDDPSRMWLVASGEVSVMTSHVDRGLPVGLRSLVFEAGVGTPLFPVSDGRSEDAERLIVTSTAEVTFYEAPLRAASELLALTGLSLRDAIDDWTNKLSRFAARDELFTGADRFPHEGKFGLADGMLVSVAPNQVAWLKIESGDLNAFGDPELAVGTLPFYMPVGGEIWFQAAGETRVRVSDELTQASDLDLVRGLALFNSLLQRRLREFERDSQQAERERLERSAATEARIFDNSMEQLAGVLNRREAAPQRETLLLTAATIVGNAIGVDMQPPARSEDPRRLKDPVEAIARASRVRQRTVILAGRWWEMDNGPLLAYLEDDDVPVALVRDQWQGYQMIDPRDGIAVPVTPEIALSLKPKGVMFYPRLPESVRTAWGVPRFAMRGRMWDMIFVALLSLTITGIGMLVPQATALIMDNAIPDANRRLLAELGAGLAMAAFGAALFGIAQGILSIRLGILSDSVSQSAVWDRLLTLRLPLFRQFSSGDLLDRAMSVSAVNQELNGQAMRTLLTSGTALLNLGLLYYYSSKLAWMVAGIGLAVVLFTLCAGFFARRHYRRLMELQGPFFGFVVELVNAVSKIRIAGAQRRAFARWADRFVAQLELILKAQGIEDYVSVFNLMIPLVSSMFLFWMGVEMLNADGPERLSVGVFLAFNTAMGTFLGGATTLSVMGLEFLDTVAKAARVKPLLVAESEISPDLRDPGRLSGQIEFKDVHFAYGEDGPPVLRGVSFRIMPEQFVAFVGPSGSGKSTIIRLLLGFEDPGAGVVAYDDQDLSGLDVTAVRRQLGVVLQTARINSASIFDNIGGGANITLDEAWEAAEDAGFADDVREMPMEMHTVISEGGTNLSGGQRQRLLIARALVRNPRILVFDEATSALDNKTQAIVTEALDRRKVTRLVIAHRLSTIRNADRIFVLADGRIVESGTFDDLVRNGGIFASMMARQIV